MPNVLNVGPGQQYPSLLSAYTAASNGDVIYLMDQGTPYTMSPQFDWSKSVHLLGDYINTSEPIIIDFGSNSVTYGINISADNVTMQWVEFQYNTTVSWNQGVRITGQNILLNKIKAYVTGSDCYGVAIGNSGVPADVVIKNSWMYGTYNGLIVFSANYAELTNSVVSSGVWEYQDTLDVSDYVTSATTGYGYQYGSIESVSGFPPPLNAPILETPEIIDSNTIKWKWEDTTVDEDYFHLFYIEGDGVESFINSSFTSLTSRDMFEEDNDAFSFGKGTLTDVTTVSGALSLRGFISDVVNDSFSAPTLDTSVWTTFTRYGSVDINNGVLECQPPSTQWGGSYVYSNNSIPTTGVMSYEFDIIPGDHYSSAQLPSAILVNPAASRDTDHYYSRSEKYIGLEWSSTDLRLVTRDYSGNLAERIRHATFQTSLTGNTLGDGNFHHVKFTLDPYTRVVQVYYDFDATPAIEYTLTQDLIDDLGSEVILEVGETDYNNGTLVAPEQFDNIVLTGSAGYALSGSRVSPTIDLTPINTYESGNITWTAQIPVSGDLLIETSLDGGSTWNTVTNNGGSIPGLTPQDNVTGKDLIVRQTLTSFDGTETPVLEDLTINIRSADSVQWNVSYTDSGLLPNNAYRIGVSAGSNISSTGQAVSGDYVYTPAKIPVAPNLTNNGDGSALFSIPDDGNAPDSLYCIKEVSGDYIDESGNYSSTLVLQTSAQWSPLTLTPPEGTHAYEVYVQQKSDSSLVGPSTAVGFTTPPEVPTILTPIAEPDGIVWQWQDNSAIENDYDIHYTVGGLSDVIDLPADTVSYKETLVSPNTQYAAQIKASGAGGESNYSSVATLYSAAAVPAAPLTGVATVTTAEVTPAKGTNPTGTELALYNVTDDNYINASGGPSATPVWQTEAQWGTVTVNSLSSGTSYEFGTYARNHDGVVTAMSPTGAVQTAVGISGIVTEVGIPVERTVRLYNRANGVLADETMSNVSGEYEFQVPDALTPYYVVVVDDDAGVDYNAVIQDRVHGG